MDKEVGRRWFQIYYDSTQAFSYLISYLTPCCLLAALLLYKVVPLVLGPVLFVIDAPFGRFYSNSRWSMNGMLKLGTLIEILPYEEPISDRSP